MVDGLIQNVLTLYHIERNVHYGHYKIALCRKSDKAKENFISMNLL